MKLCTKCRGYKHTSLFYKRTFASGRIGVQSHCKSCADKKHEEYVHRKYGVDYEALPPKPSVCELCNRGGKICLDHDHDTGKFRGWLCDHCNRGLGLLRDSPTLLREAAEYIERTK